MLPKTLKRLAFLTLVLIGPAIQAQSGLKDLPPQGMQVDAGKLAALKQKLLAFPETKSPDVVVFTRAVKLAIEQNLFYRNGDVEKASGLLDYAAKRHQSYGQASSEVASIGFDLDARDKPQTLVGGFTSDVDDSVQPFGIVLPVGFDPDKRYRLDVWLHGRGDTKTEVPFLIERMTKVGQYAPADTIVLHPFGRHCNAFKFAGEVDVYEAIDHVSKFVKIDPNRIAIRGFSMGGAGCWHIAAHDPARWFAANPGAGFVDTIVYQGWTDQMPFPLDATRRKLFRWYDVLPWTANFRNTKLIAYNGELDKQRQSGERVAAESKKLGLEWPHVIGPKMGHKIDPESANRITAMLDEYAAAPIQVPRRKIDFLTYTLRYPTADWVTVTGMKEHWTPARVTAEIIGDDQIRIQTSGVTHLELDFGDIGWPTATQRLTITVDGDRVEDVDTSDDPGYQLALVTEGGWKVNRKRSWTQRKRPGLQGPIDDALTSKFVFVVPSRPARHGVVDRWVKRELQYAKRRWREIMRGDVQVVRDTDVTEQHIENCNLICFGDFQGNRFLSRIKAGLPVKWSADEIKFKDKTFPAMTHVPVFCFPNPANPQRYVVVNSGHTFRKFSNTSNSRQIAMLPDWAILDVESEYDESIFAGKVIRHGFFNENWQ